MICDVTDTSVYQGAFDVSAFDGAGVIAKLTQGTWRVDPYGQRTFNLARAKPFRWCGLYHFMDSSPAVDQYAHFAGQLEALLGLNPSKLPRGVGIALDWESNAITGEPLPSLDVLDKLLWYCCVAGQLPRERVAIYSYLSAIRKLPDDVRALHPIWLAWPGDEQVARDEGATLWQWGVETTVPGIAPLPALCDNVLDRERMDRWFGVAAPFPETKEVPMFMMQGPAGIADGVFLLEAQTIRWVDDPAELAILNQAGVPMVTDSLDAIRMMRSKRIPFGPPPSSGGLVGLW